MNRVLIALLAGLLLWGSAGAAELTVVRAGRLLDVEKSHALEDQAIRIEDGRIVSIERFDAARVGDAHLIDWSAHTVLPGLIDLHTHLTGEIWQAGAGAQLMTSAAQDVLLGVAHARTTLHSGFTTVRDVGTARAYVDVALRNAINDGLIEGPRMYVAGAYVTVSKGGGEITGFAPDIQVPAEMQRGVANSVDEVRKRVRELVAGGADFIKVIATGAVLTLGTAPSAPEYSEAEIRAAVDEAALLGTYVAAHAHGEEGIRRAVRAGVRSIEHGSYLEKEGIALMVKHGTWLVADVYNGDYIDEVGRRDNWPAETLRKNTETTGTQRAAFTGALKAGVNIGFGTDSGVYPHGDNARQFAYMVRHGMTPWQAIRSATIDAARALGKDAEIGSLAAGKRADLIAVTGDPLTDVERLRSISGVIKDGRLVHLSGDRP